MTINPNDVRNSDYLWAHLTHYSRFTKGKAYFVEGECITDDSGYRHFVTDLDLYGFSHWRSEHDLALMVPGDGLLRMADNGSPWFTKGKVYILDASPCMTLDTGSLHSASTNFARANFVLLKSVKAEQKEVSEQMALAIKVESYLKENGYTSGNIPIVLATFLKGCFNLDIEYSYSIIEKKELKN